MRTTSLTIHFNAHKSRKRYEELGASSLKEDLRKKKIVPEDLYRDPPSSVSDSANSTPINSSSVSSSILSNAQEEVSDEFVRPAFPVPAQANDNQNKNIPHPDDRPPSYEFNTTFKGMIDSEILPPWEDFETLLNNFINFSKDFINIKDPPEMTTIFKQQNVENPKFIQALYCQKRQRAV